MQQAEPGPELPCHKAGLAQRAARAAGCSTARCRQSRALLVAEEQPCRVLCAASCSMGAGTHSAESCRGTAGPWALGGMKDPELRTEGGRAAAAPRERVQ